MYTADYFISKLDMDTHIEGGYYKEIYKNSKVISNDSCVCKFEGNRNLSTTIYFLLKSEQVSKFHKLKFDEIWFYHYGAPMVVHMIDQDGNYTSKKLGLNIANDELPQVLVPANTVFGAELLEEDTYSLVSCMVSPGFDYRDFVLFEEKELSSLYPEHSKLIKKLNG